MGNCNAKYFYSRVEVAGMLGVSYVTIDRLVKSGRLPCKHLGRRVLFTLPDVQAFASAVGASIDPLISENDTRSTLEIIANV